MSGPVTTGSAIEGDEEPTRSAVVEVTDSRVSRVGAFAVRRALPQRRRRMVGPWCFVDHMGPASVDEGGLGVAPHPHIGLQTVTWLLSGEALHRDSLGSEQVIAPGQLNLMTAGRGVSHSEEGTGRAQRDLHGVQLWVAQPERTRHGDAAFEHHPELPMADFDNATATVLVGELDGATSPARQDTDHAAVDIELRAGRSTLPLQTDFEYALVVFTGVVEVDGAAVEPGKLGYLGANRDELTFTAPGSARALLVGGVPFEESIVMWWNYVGRTRDEILDAHADWTAASGRFGKVTSALPRVEVGPPPWTRR